MRVTPERHMPPTYWALRAWAEEARGWAADAEEASAGWPGMTDAQRDAVLRATITRLGVLCTRQAAFYDHLATYLRRLPVG